MGSVLGVMAPAPAPPFHILRSFEGAQSLSTTCHYANGHGGIAPKLAKLFLRRKTMPACSSDTSPFESNSKFWRIALQCQESTRLRAPPLKWSANSGSREFPAPADHWRTHCFSETQNHFCDFRFIDPTTGPRHQSILLANGGAIAPPTWPQVLASHPESF